MKLRSSLSSGLGMILLAGPAAAAGPTLSFDPPAAESPANPAAGLDLLDHSTLRLEKAEVPDFPAARESERKEAEVKTLKQLEVLLLTDEARGALADFVKRAVRVRQDAVRTKLDQVVNEIREKTKPDEAGVAALKTLGDTLLQEEMKMWENDFQGRMAVRLGNLADPVAQVKGWNVQQILNREPSPALAVMLQGKAWQDGLKKILKPEAFAAMEQEAAAKKETILKESADYLADATIQVKTALGNRMDTELDQVLQFAGLDETREKSLREAGEKAIGECLQKWRTRVETDLLGKDEKERIKLQNGQTQVAVDPEDPDYQPQSSPAWLAAKQAILTDAEKAGVEQRRLQARQKRVSAIASVILAETDRLVGFNQAQREKILELGCARLMALPANALESASGMGSTFFDPGRTLTELQQIPDHELQANLDAGQIKRWKAMTREKLMSYRSYSRSSGSSDKIKRDTGLDETGAQRQISELLVREANKQKQVFAEVMEARVDQVARTTGISGETSGLLRTAAKGAAERMSRSSINNLEQHVRQQLRGVKPPDIPVRIRNLSLPINPDRTGPSDPAIWTAAVDRLLAPDQRKAWQAETDARELWRLKSMVSLVSTEVAKNVVLTAEKETLLQQQLEASIRKYETDIVTMISPGWYLQSYYSQIPLALLTEKQMAEIFTPKQREAVATKALGFAAQYADMIRQRHQSRTRQ